MNKKLKLDEKFRKEIYHFRIKRKELKNNPIPEETDPIQKAKNEIVDEVMKRMVPSYFEHKKMIEEAADSAWFAMSEIERFSEHCDNIHKNDGGACSKDGCLEDFTREDSTEFMKTIMEHLEKELENE